MARPASIRSIRKPPAPGAPEPDASHSIFRVVLHEGRNREVRRLWNAVGFEVSRLLRVRYGPIELPDGMRPGTVRRADAALIERLDRAAGGKGTRGRCRPGAARAPAAAPGPRRPAGDGPPGGCWAGRDRSLGGRPSK